MAQEFVTTQDGNVEFTYVIPADKLALAAAAFAASYGHTEEDGLSLNEFMLKKIQDFVNEVTVGYYARVAQERALAAANAAAASLKLELTVK